MKQGWEIKKLVEVCEINPSKKEANTKLGLDDKVSFLPMEDLGINAYYITPSQERLLSEVLSSYTYFADGDVLLAKVSPCFENGKIGIANNLTNGVGFGSSEYLTFRLGKDVINEFLYFYLQNKTFVKEATKNLTGTSGLRRVPKSFVESCRIPVPPREEQERIVAELDCLSGVIERKREQLRELDALAQSIFYQMFGDPITNEKGWEVKKLGEVCIINPQKKEAATIVDNTDEVSFLPMEDLSIKACYIQPKQSRIFSEVQSSYTYFKNGDVLLAKVSPCFENGKIGIAQNLINGVGFGSSEYIVFRLNTSILKEYLYFFLQDATFVEEATKNLTGTSGLRRVPKSFVENRVIGIPPLTLQQEFADKIEAIEKQKELIKQSITQTEELFNSRMDYYFN